MANDKRPWLIFGISVLTVIGMFSIPPIQQNISYHAFADSRNIFHIPNFFNVVSNLPFVAIGVAGIYHLSSGNSKPTSHPVQMIFLVFFAGLVLTGLGSGYYHSQPDNFTLVWDRLPMTFSFTSFFCLVIAECISIKLAKQLLLPLLMAGMVSVGYWYLSEQRGFGDLRPYMLIQFLPMALLPLILWLYDREQGYCSYAWTVLGLYLIAKVAELFDAELFNILQLISGHTLKHLLAGMGTYFIYRRSISHAASDTINT